MSTLSSRIMNLIGSPGLSEINTSAGEQLAYKRGHRDARHAAAELALVADDLLAALEGLVAGLEKEGIGADGWCSGDIHGDEYLAALAAIMQARGES